ncbi:MAG: ABC transporter ATP-binding protein [Bacteroidetes bacterium]|nr:MAG: ABC transporter ATP-binding protein [Bacteroidota bacterium]
MQDLFSTNKYLFRYKYHLLGGIVFVTLANIFAIVPAQAVRNSIDLVADTIQLYFLYTNTPHQTKVYEVFAKSVLYYGLIIVGMAFVRGIFMFLMRQTVVVMSRLVEFDQKNEIYAHYQTLPLSFYRKNDTGDLMARISEDVGKVRMYFGPAILYGLNMITMTILCIGFMLSINVKLTLFTLLPLPILSITIYYVNTIIEKRSTEIQKSLSGISVFVQEAFSGIRVIKAFAREQDSLRQFAEESEKYREKNLALVRVSSVFTPSVMALVGLSILIVVFVGGIEVINGNISAGNVAEFIMYVTMLTWPFTSLGWISSIMQRADVSQKRINEFLNTKTNIVSTENITKSVNGKITFENVSLTYSESNIEALKKVSFTIEAGQSIALLGNTGSGKSTLANTICRLMDPLEGKILIDDIDIKKYNISNLRSQIGYVPQDVFLFSDTIKNNIIFGSNISDESQILDASQKADLHQNITQFAAGYDTILGERGITLSGGQKQRLSIARAIIKNPKILILDDSLSAVDTHTENTILNHLETIMKNKTSIIISHRVSSAKLADKIMLLDNGEIIEQGTHHELMKLGKKYAEMYESQIEISNIV